MPYEIRFTRGRRVILKPKQFLTQEPQIIFTNTPAASLEPDQEEEDSDFFRREQIAFIRKEES